MLNYKLNGKHIKETHFEEQNIKPINKTINKASEASLYNITNKIIITNKNITNKININKNINNNNHNIHINNTNKYTASEASLHNKNNQTKNNQTKNTNHISKTKRKPKKILYPARLHINKKPNTRFYKESTSMASEASLHNKTNNRYSNNKYSER